VLRRCGPLLVLALAGCGGVHTTRFADTRPCLAKLALVVPDERLSGQTVDAANVDLSYHVSDVTATAAHLTFYAHPSDAKEQLRQAKHALATGLVRPGPPPELVKRSVVVTWSSRPGRAQRRQLLACVG
jgi:hypothetical protein